MNRERLRTIAKLLIMVLLGLLAAGVGSCCREVNAHEPSEITCFLKGDESLAGLSYYLDAIYEDRAGELTEPYIRILLLGKETLPAYTISSEEYEILCRIVEAEATGGTIEQKMNVASCIFARIESADWEDDVKAVVFSHSNGIYQFTPISDGRYYTVRISDSTREAVDKVLQDGKTHDCLFFCSYGSYAKEGSWHRNNLTEVFRDGEHVYSR